MRLLTKVYSVEEVNKLVQQGIPFREAYQQVVKNIEEETFNPDRQLSHTHIGSIGNLCNTDIAEKFKAVLKD